MNDLLTGMGVQPRVDRSQRSITLGQDGLLDQCSHLDAARLREALAWVLQLTDITVSGGATDRVNRHLPPLYSLLDCLDEIADELNPVSTRPHDSD